MKCVSCGQKKGKRTCPAKNGLICAQCCGEKRVVAIPCPVDCPHLSSGQTYHSIKQYLSLLDHEESPARRRAYIDALTDWGDAVDAIEKTIVAYAADVRALRDSDVKEAVEAVRKTCESEERGFLFEHSSPNPLAQALVRELKTQVEQTLNQEPDAESRPPRNVDLIQCFQLVEAKLAYHQAQGGGRRAFLEFISRSHPEKAARSSRGGLIIP